MTQVALSEFIRAIEAAGLVLRGGFAVVPTDRVPDIQPGQPAKTLILLGNAGPGMWQRFSATRNREPMTLDQWSEKIIGGLACRFGARALFPFAKPYLPFQSWARKAEACFVSPIGMSIHPRYGLWHAYRGALAFADPLDVPLPADAISPCVTCADQPCLTACPVNAFSEAGYDTSSCSQYLESSDGANCLSNGCRARRACPVGTEFIYEPAQAHFHMAAFLQARRAE